MDARSSQRAELGYGQGDKSPSTVLDARFASLEVLRSLLPDLIIAIDIQMVRAITSLAESTIYSKIDPAHEAFDPEFPVPAKLGKRSVWKLSAVQAYLQKKFELAANSQPLTTKRKSATQIHKLGVKK